MAEVSFILTQSGVQKGKITNKEILPREEGPNQKKTQKYLYLKGK